MPATGIGILPEDPSSSHYDQVLYLLPVSKDIEATITIANPTDPARECKGPPTRKTLQRKGVMVLTLHSHNCETTVNTVTVRVKPLLMLFADGAGTNRGVHVGTFIWSGPEGTIRGRLSGTVNSSAVRTPFAKPKPTNPCDRPCHLPGSMDGRMSGLIQSTGTSRDYLLATYHISFDATESGSSTGGKGTIEGVIVRVCQKP